MPCTPPVAGECVDVIDPGLDKVTTRSPSTRPLTGSTVPPKSLTFTTEGDRALPSNGSGSPSTFPGKSTGITSPTGSDRDLGQAGGDQSRLELLVKSMDKAVRRLKSSSRSHSAALVLKAEEGVQSAVPARGVAATETVRGSRRLGEDAAVGRPLYSETSDVTEIPSADPSASQRRRSSTQSTRAGRRNVIHAGTTPEARPDKGCSHSEVSRQREGSFCDARHDDGDRHV